MSSMTKAGKALKTVVSLAGRKVFYKFGIWMDS